jgi:ABC-type transport system involved in multi-copper enzyme maturation permease subunit
MRAIVFREIRDHIQSLQFVALLLFSIALFSANGIIFARKFQAENAAYSAAAAQFAPNTQYIFLTRQPNPLLFLAEGGDLDRPASYYMMAKGYFSASAPRPRDYKLPDIPKLDWSFIVKTVFSLYVVLLGYAAVCGEKEQGTLRLVLSNPVGRVRFLAAKYAAILAAALIPLAVGCVISLGILGVSLPQILTWGLASRVASLLALSAAYLSLFAFLSLLVSSVMRRSSLALLCLLAAWVLFAVLIPDTSGILAEKFAKVQSDYDAAKSVGPMIEKEVWAKIGALQPRIDKGELKTAEAIKAEADKAFEEGQEKVRFFEKSYEDSLAQRAALARSLARISPVALFQYAAEDLAGSGTHREEAFREDLRAYSREFDAYVLKKNGKLVGQSNWSFSTSVKLAGKDIEIRSPQAEAYRGDMSDFPRLVERAPRLGDGVKSAAGDIAGLLLWNIVLALAAFATFLKTDVR